MNFVHIESLVKVIYMIIFNKIKEGEYCLKNNKFIKIQKLIKTLNNGKDFGSISIKYITLNI